MVWPNALVGNSKQNLWVVGVVVAALVCSFSATALANKKKAKPAPPKQAALVLDANTGAVLHAEHADDLRYPASLTKMMTLYMLFSEIERGKLTLNSRLRLSRHARRAPPSKIGFKPRQSIKVKDAIKALVVKSANDVARAVAEKIGRTESGFARMMTKRARKMGMTRTTFANASGLPNRRQKSTARDMVTLALRLQDDFPQHYHFFALKEFSYRGKTYRSHNNLLKRFPGMDGMKTGYIRAAGFNLVSSVRTGNKHVVAAVFGGKTAKARDAHMQILLFKGLERASTKRTRPILKRRPTPVASSKKPKRAPQKAKVISVQKAAKAPQKNAHLKTLQAEFAKPALVKPATPAKPPAQPNPIAQTNPIAALLAGLQSAEQEPAQSVTVRPPAAQPHGDWQIQIGAFSSRPEAEALISNMRRQNQQLLAPYRGVVATTVRNGSQIFRSRFAGFSEEAATRACAEMRRANTDCFKMRGSGRIGQKVFDGQTASH